jgi:hypothetical protein
LLENRRQLRYLLEYTLSEEAAVQYVVHTSPGLMLMRELTSSRPVRHGILYGFTTAEIQKDTFFYNIQWFLIFFST